MAVIAAWHEVAARLIDTAMGRQPADTVVRNCRWVNVHSGEVITGTDIAIAAGRFAFVGASAAHAIGPNTAIVEADGRYAMPGLCDAHMHVESGMVTVGEFVRAVLPRGTTSMFIDPHEIANVLGLDGVRMMHDDAMLQPANVFVQMPSCVPSAPGLEHAGATISADDVAQAMQWPGIIGLGEVMNFPAVAHADPGMLAEISATAARGRTIGGHYAAPVDELMFHGYAASGAADDHEGTKIEDAIARVRQGMAAMLRLGSAWYDVASQIKAVTEMGLDSRKFILCTDDCHAGTLVHDGHMDRVVRHAIAQGLPPVTAIQMATVNAAAHFGLERDIGSIAPGRRADLILTSDLPTLPIEMVLAGGDVYAENGRLTKDWAHFPYPATARQTMNIGALPDAGKFAIRAPKQPGPVVARVIGVVENQAPTRALSCPVPVTDGIVDAAEFHPTAEVPDLAQIALVERHGATGTVQNGLVSGFGYNRRCAVASTVAHDSHHLIVVGTDRQDMASAVAHLDKIGGGAVVVSEGTVLADVPLPIAGLMSDQPAAVVAGQAQALIEAMAACGCAMNNAFMQHSLLALVVIPELRLSDLGLVDVRAFETTPLFVT